MGCSVGDHLFDARMISFSEAEDLPVSEKLPEKVLGLLGLKRGLKVGGFKAEQKVYLEWHRKAYRFG